MGEYSSIFCPRALTYRGYLSNSRSSLFLHQWFLILRQSDVEGSAPASRSTSPSRDRRIRAFFWGSPHQAGRSVPVSQNQAKSALVLPRSSAPHHTKVRATKVGPPHLSLVTLASEAIGGGVAWVNPQQSQGETPWLDG